MATDHLRLSSMLITEESLLNNGNQTSSNKRVLDSDVSFKNGNTNEDGANGAVGREVKRHQPLLLSSSDVTNLDATSILQSSTTIQQAPVSAVQQTTSAFPPAGSSYSHSYMNEHNNQMRNPSTDSSRTIIIRNVAEDATTSDVAFLLSPFATGAPVVTFLSPDEVLVEMDSAFSADRAVRYLNIHQISLKGTVVTAAFSSMPEGPYVVGHATDGLKSKTDPVSFRVVLVTITDIRYPVDIDLLHRLFSVYGKVEKIVTFVKSSNRYQALIQFGSARDAREAFNSLNNKCIFDGCNKIQIQSSKLSQLVVKQNCEKSWDFTVAPMSLKGLCDQAPRSPMGMSGLMGGLPANDYSHFPTTGLSSNVSPNYVSNSQAHHQLMGGMQTGTPSHGMSMSSSNAPVSFVSSPQQFGSPQQNHQASLQQASVSSGHQSLPPQLMEKLPRELQNYATLHQLNPLQSMVVICYNLPAAEITVPKLFNLLSLYGVVLRIKLLREKPGTALAQYSHPLYATLACHFLANAPFFGVDSGLQIGISRKTEVKLPPPAGVIKETPEESKRTMAFQAQDQRAKPEEVEKFIRGACKPTNTLFVANIHESVEENSLREIMSTVGTVLKIQMRPPKQQAKRITAMVELSSEKEALSAICHLHNHQLAGCNIKLAFSKQILH